MTARKPKRARTRRIDDPMAYFWEHVEKTEACWVWKGPAYVKGYGRINVEGRAQRVHRFSYEKLKGPIPDGLCLDHLCSNRICVNPDHLEAVTLAENTMRSRISLPSINRDKASCYRGHPFSPENTVMRTKSTGRSYRVCLTCRRENNARLNPRRFADWAESKARKP